MNRGTHSSRVAWVLALLSLGAAGCGDDADFGSPSQKTNDKDALVVDQPVVEPLPSPKPTPPSLASLTWYWQCSAEPGSLPPATPENAVVQNEGPHQFAKGMLVQTPVTFKGKLCPPAAQPRDIVFVIDTSGSMGGTTNNDPRVANSCGRLSAVQAAIAATPTGTARFGVVTFSSGVDATSTGLFATQAELFANLAPAGNIADILCAANANTYYDAGLNQAATLLQTGRAEASKEVYLLSDGLPSTGHDGIAHAQVLKTSGVNVGTAFYPVTIATIMLGGADGSVLRDSIASTGATGEALHANVSQTGQLASVLTQLAANEIVAATLKYRAIGAGDWTSLDLMAHLQGFEFALPSFTIDLDAAAAGLEVVYEYHDAKNHRVSTGGKILWTVDGGG